MSDAVTCCHVGAMGCATGGDDGAGAAGAGAGAAVGEEAASGCVAGLTAGAAGDAGTVDVAPDGTGRDGAAAAGEDTGS